MERLLSPKISIIIATYNSEKRLPLVIDSILNQDFPIENLEVILVDGFSKDNTRGFAKKYPFIRVIDNPEIDPVNAKYLGYKAAKSNILVFLDHDEVFSSKTSLSKRFRLCEDKNIVALSPSGYINPPGYSFINQYINSFGDPFSAFFYSLSKDHSFFINELKKKYPITKETEECIIFDFKNSKNLPILELVAGSSTIKKNFLEGNNITAFQLPLTFNAVVESQLYVGFIKNDPIKHYSSETYTNYFNKIKWRIKNNIFKKNQIGLSGFSGRENGTIAIKKYFFIPYNILIIPVFLHTIFYCFKYRNIRYFIHFYFSLYTCSMILFYYLVSLLHIRADEVNYDGSKK